MSTMRNSVTLIGRPGAEPEMKTLNNNQKITRFSLAVNESFVNANNERVDNLYWFNIVAWGDNASRAVKYIRKGKLVAIQGALHNNEWTDKDGGRHMTTEIWAEDFFPIEFPKEKTSPDNTEKPEKEKAE